MVVSRGGVLAHQKFREKQHCRFRIKKEAKNATSLKVAKIEDKGIDKVIDMSKFSSFDKLLRVTSWVFRFVQNCRAKEGHGGDFSERNLGL